MKTNVLPRIAYKQNEAAQVLGVSDRTLRDWMAGDNPPPSFRRGKILLFPHDQLVKWMQKQLANSSSEKSGSGTILPNWLQD